MSNVFHTVSKTEACRMLDHYPKADGKLIIIPKGFEEDVLRHKRTGKGNDYTIYAGRIEKYKRLELAVDLAKN